MQPGSQKKLLECACFCERKRRNKNYMDLKDFVSGGWKQTSREPTPRLKEERLPTYIPLNKPTRDISASNKSHSLTHDDFQLTFPASQRRNILLDRHIEDYEYQKQANIIFNRQFKALAKLLGDETMEFDELKQGIEKLILRDNPQPDPTLVDRINSLERQLAKKTKFAQVHIKSGNSPLANNSEYVKSLQAELEKKSKMIAQLSDSINRETFQEVVRNLQQEMAEKSECLNKAQQEKLELRSRTTAQISTLEAEVIKLTQINKKLTMEVEALNRKSLTFAEEKSRAERREKELSSSFEADNKVVYKGFNFTITTLLLQLESRDQQLSEMQANFQQKDQQRTKTRNELNKLKQSQRKSQSIIEQLTSQKIELEIYLNKYRKEIEEQKKELEMKRSENESRWQELQKVNGQLAQIKQNTQQLQIQESKLHRVIDNLTESIHSHEQTQKDLRLEREKYIKTISDLQSTLNDKLKIQCDLEIHISTIEKQITAMEHEKSQMQQELVEIERNKQLQIEDLQQKLEQVDKERNELIEELEGLGQSVSQLKGHIEYLQDQLRQREQEIETFQTQNNHLQQEIQDKSEQIQNIDMKNTSKRNLQERQIQDYKKRLKEQSQTITNLQIQLSQHIKNNEYYRTLEVELIQLKDLETKRLNEISENRKEEEKIIESLKKEKYQLTSKCNAIQKELQIAEEQLKRQQKQNEENSVLKHQLNEQIGRLMSENQHNINNLQQLGEENNKLVLTIEKQQSSRSQIIKKFQQKITILEQNITVISSDSVSKHNLLCQQVEHYKIQLSTIQERYSLQQKALYEIKLQREDLLKKLSMSQSTICQTSFLQQKPSNHQETIDSLTSQIKSYEAQFVKVRDENINRLAQIEAIKKQIHIYRVQIEENNSQIAVNNQHIKQLQDNIYEQEKKHKGAITFYTGKLKESELQLAKQIQKSKQMFDDLKRLKGQNDFYRQSINEYEAQVLKYKAQITQFIERQEKQKLLEQQKQKINQNSSISDNKSKQKDPGSGSKSIDEIRQFEKGLDPSKISGQQSKIPTILKNLYKSQLDKLPENNIKPQTERSDPKYTEPENNRLSSVSNSSKRSIANSLNPPTNMIKQENKQIEQSNRQEYLPQHSSKRGNLANTINFVVQPRPIPTSPQEIYTSDFHRHIYTNNTTPIYIARPSMLIHQQSIERKDSQSNSTGKHKIKISYGKPQEKSIEMKPHPVIQDPKSTVQMKNSQIMNSILQQPQRKQSQKSISFRQSKAQQSCKNGDNNRVKTSRPPSQINNLHTSRVQAFDQPNPSSIINAILQPEGHAKSPINSIESQKPQNVYSMTQTFGRLSNQPQSSNTTVYFSPFKYAQHFPKQQNNFLKTGRVESIPSISVDTLTSIKLAQTSRQTPLHQDYYTREAVGGMTRNSKIAMRSVAGSKRSSQYAAQDSKEEERDRLSSISSQDSGIQILQQDWMPPCCLQE